MRVLAFCFPAPSCISAHKYHSTAKQPRAAAWVAVTQGPPPPLAPQIAGGRRAFERLLRKVLSLHSRPAVVLVHMFSALAAAEDIRT